MARRAAIALLSLVLIASAMPVNAQTGPPEVDDRLRAYSIAPPGQEGDVTVDEFASEDYGPHYSDQLDMYASLVKDNDVTEAELDDYYHSMQFGPGDVEDDYEPATGVHVYRDSFGIPHIYADSLETASFGLGYVTAEDRLWQMDVLRHAARGDLAEFAGPDYLPMDIAVRREGYTQAEVQKMYDDFDAEFGALGERIQSGLQSYADGINAYIEELRTTRQDECPVEYFATDNPCPVPFPEEWQPTDTLFLVILQLRTFGETAGGELHNAALYSHLQKRLGKKKGRRVFADFLRQSDPRTYTSIPKKEGRWRSQDLGRLNRRSLAIPDQAGAIAEDSAAEDRLVQGFLESMGFKAPASNALLVSARESKTDNPLQIGAPQVGYANPGFFMEVDVHFPGVDFRGPAVPGASALIPLGRGVDYAWTLTTGYSDAVDVRAELLCEKDGSPPTRDSNAYMFRGECREMRSRTEQFLVKPTATDPPGTPPSVVTKTFHRTVHGPVFARGNVNKRPVAFVKERFFWKREVDSIPPFYRWNARVDDLGDFRAAARRFTMSFNTFYADANHIGYFHVGMYPRRTRGVHPALPVWGTGKWEWKGRFPFKRHPKIVDPKQGWIVNWNNRPAAGWNNFDSQKWGSIHRVRLLSDRMKRLVGGGGKAKLSDLVDVIRGAATQDTRGVYLGPRILRMASKRARGGSLVGTALDFVKTWVRRGAHRHNRDGNEFMDASPAVATFDAWYNVLVHRVFDDELGDRGYEYLAANDAPVFDHAMWFDFSTYLKNSFSRRSRRPLARNYCDNIKTRKRESCGEVVFKALKGAVARLKKKQGGDIASWKADAEWIEFSPNFGAGTVPDIPWQNRGTHNHVVEILSNAP